MSIRFRMEPWVGLRADDRPGDTAIVVELIFVPEEAVHIATPVRC